MIINLAIIRILALVIVCGLFIFVENKVVYSLFSPFLLAHYIIAAIYSLKFRVVKEKGNRLIVSLLILTALSFLITYNQYFHILLYFGIHFTLTDVYLHRYLGLKESKLLLSFRYPFTAFTYCYFIRETYFLQYFGDGVVFFYLAIISFIGIVIASIYEKENFPWYEVPMLIAVVLSNYFNEVFQPYSVILYHIVLWFFLPMLKLKSKSIKVCSYHLILFAILFIYPLKDDWFIDITKCRDGACIGFMAYFHVTISFASSTLNPVFLQRFLGFSKSS